MSPHNYNSQPPSGTQNWTPQIYQGAPGHRVEQWTEYQFAEYCLIDPDGRTTTQFGASWRWYSSSSGSLPPASRAPLIAPAGILRPSILMRPYGAAEKQLHWAPGTPVPEQLALPNDSPWWRRLLGGRQ
jgi:hypothetical protein